MTGGFLQLLDVMNDLQRGTEFQTHVSHQSVRAEQKKGFAVDFLEHSAMETSQSRERRYFLEKASSEIIERRVNASNECRHFTRAETFGTTAGS